MSNLDEVHTKNGVKMDSFIFTHDIVGVKRPWKEIDYFWFVNHMIGPLVIFKCSLNILLFNNLQGETISINFGCDKQ
jgi:hypothetical protein